MYVYVHSFLRLWKKAHLPQASRKGCHYHGFALRCNNTRVEDYWPLFAFTDMYCLTRPTDVCTLLPAPFGFCHQCELITPSNNTYHLNSWATLLSSPGRLPSKNAPYFIIISPVWTCSFQTLMFEHSYPSDNISECDWEKKKRSYVIVRGLNYYQLSRAPCKCRKIV